MPRLAAALLALACVGASAQPLDSLATVPPVDTLATAAPMLVAADSSSGPTPRGAVVRSLAVPGWGQVYAGQPAKAPFALAFVAGAAAYFANRQRTYVLYRRASVVAGCLVDDGTGAGPDAPDDPDRIALCADADARYRDEYDAVNEGLATPAEFNAIRTVRAQVRGQRDVGALILLGAYALQALDAYVAAELSDFDVGEDLRLSVRPEAGRVSLRVRF